MNTAKKFARDTLAIILAGGRGNRLMSLTDFQAKPAVPFGGTYRIVDFTLSNCFNSGFKRIHMLTQYQSESLEDYINQGWHFLKNDKQEFINILPAGNGKAYKGTADAVYQNLEVFAGDKAEWVLILAGDHIYKMDYAAMLEEHIASKAELTIPCITVPRATATAFGVMKVDETNRIIDFLEKPANPPGMPDNPEQALVSMGIYIFNRKFLEEILTTDAKNEKSNHDFGMDIVPAAVNKARVMAHRFLNSCVRVRENDDAYWRDVGTVDAYWAANMDMTKAHPDLDLYDQHWPIFTASKSLPPTKFICDKHDVLAKDSLIADGCIIENATITKSLVSDGVHIETDSDINESILLPDVKVGKNVSLKKTIVEGGCHLPDGLVVGQNAEDDAKRFHRTSNGVVLINHQMLNALHNETSLYKR